MSGHERPVHVSDATVTDRHLSLAARHATVEDCPRDYSGPFLGVGVAAVIGAVAGYGYPAEHGNVTLGVVLATLAVAAGVAGWLRVGHNQRRSAQWSYAQALAYLEQLRGKDLDRTLGRWCDEHPHTRITYLAEAVEALAVHIGADRTHQLMVLAARTGDFDMFFRLRSAATTYVDGTSTLDHRRADCYAEVVDAILASHEPVGDVADIERMLDAADQRRVDMAL